VSTADPVPLATLRARLRPPPPPGGGGVAFGDARVDGCLPDGLARAGWHEIGADGIEAELGALAAAFAASWLSRLAGAAPVLWIAPTADLHPPGLCAYGLDPGRLLLAHSRDDAGTLAAMETALRGGAVAAVVGEVGRLGRLAGRRLHLACLAGGRPGFVLRRWPHGRNADDSAGAAATTRWRLAAAPSVAEHSEPGPPRWRVTLAHARGGRPGAWLMQAGGEDAAYAVRVVAVLADAAPDARRQRRA
jgi:protein ImuA